MSSFWKVPFLIGPFFLTYSWSPLAMLWAFTWCSFPRGLGHFLFTNTQHLGPTTLKGGNIHFDSQLQSMVWQSSIIKRKLLIFWQPGSRGQSEQLGKGVAFPSPVPSDPPPHHGLAVPQCDSISFQNPACGGLFKFDVSLSVPAWTGTNHPSSRNSGITSVHSQHQCPSLFLKGH